MDIKTLSDKLESQIIKDSGLELHRDYLGISKIGGCPRRTVVEYLRGMNPDFDAHRMSFAGYEHQASIMGLLVKAGAIARVNIEVIAPFDKRLKGHADAGTAEAELIEIKSVTRAKFDHIQKTRRCSSQHFTQIQLYMRYGGWNSAYVIYRCRETYRHEIIKVPYIQVSAERFEERAKMILAFIDKDELPECECGRCK